MNTSRASLSLCAFFCAGLLACQNSSSTASPTPSATPSVSAASAPPSASASSSASAPPAASSAVPAGPIDAGADLPPLEYAVYTNAQYAFSAEYPTFMEKRPADADGRAQSYAWKTKITIRLWAMHNPGSTKKALYEDWIRRTGVTRKEETDDGWFVEVKEKGKVHRSRSILRDGIITTAEATYDAALAPSFEPIADHVTGSIRILEGGLRKKK